jgi:predicted nucleotidyltransferase
MYNEIMAMTVSLTTPSKKTLDEVTRRIVQVAKPQRVLLFGSAAQGRMTKDSDLDILVIVRGPTHRRRLAQNIYRNLHGIAIGVDVIVVTEEDLQKYGQRAGLIIMPAIREGRLLYEA